MSLKKMNLARRAEQQADSCHLGEICLTVKDENYLLTAESQICSSRAPQIVVGQSDHVGMKLGVAFLFPLHAHVALSALHQLHDAEGAVCFPEINLHGCYLKYGSVE